jgi:hypothetical protein
MSSRDIVIWPVLGRKRVQEQSEQSFTVRFLSARALSAPTTARWKLKNLHTGEIAQDWTAIGSPTSEETIVVSGALNTIRAGFDEEVYELVVQSDYADTALRQSKSYKYKVIDLCAVGD